MFAEPEFWVAVGFVILMGVFAYVGVHRTVLTALDHRARAHQEPNSTTRAASRKRPPNCSRNTRPVMPAPSVRRRTSSTAAKAEAERIAAEAKTKMEDFVARRTKTAEGKIALAEAQAIADVRAAAANAAIAAASNILSQSVKGSVADDLLTKGIAEVRAKLN